MVRISSRDNPQYKALKKALGSNSAYKNAGWVWLEGDHLCRAALARGFQAVEWVISEEFWQSVCDSIDFIAIKTEVAKTPTLLLPQALMQALCSVDAAANIACRMALPPATQAVHAKAATVVLERVQDAGNVGAILRCAAAFGYSQVLATEGTAALWSPKVLRAAMGAHFGLQLHEGLDTATLQEGLQSLQMPVLATSSHGGTALHRMQAPWPHTWLFGNEGQGLSPTARRCVCAAISCRRQRGSTHFTCRVIRMAGCC